MSALLTTTMPYMKVVIDTLKEKGIREDYIVMVGGAPLNEEFAKAIGADAYCCATRLPSRPPRSPKAASTSS
jgi:methanogenic corrinoid protein MtbC1